jgi:hypothetical protein
MRAARARDLSELAEHESLLVAARSQWGARDSGITRQCRTLVRKDLRAPDPRSSKT